MTLPFRLRIAIWLLVFVLSHSLHSLAMTTETQEKLNAAFENLKAITPEVLHNPANKEWVEELKKSALSTGFLGAVQFLNASDPDVTEYCLTEFRSGSDFRRGDIYTTLALCSQPRLITVLGEDLKRNEPGEPKRYGDYYIASQSNMAGWIIANIIQNSPVFGKEVKYWASWGATLFRDTSKGREAMRTFWAENKELLKAQRYAEVKPPSDWEPPARVAEASPTPAQSRIAASTAFATPSPISFPPPARSPSRSSVLIVILSFLAAGIAALLLLQRK